MTSLVSRQPGSSLEDLIRSARAGEARGLGELYDRFAQTLLRIAARLTQSDEEAQDIVHDVFIGLPEALRNYTERGTFESWLKQVTARASLMCLRAEARRRENARTAAFDQQAPARSDERVEYADLERQVAALPEALRTVFVLREIEGFSHEEIAALLGISVGASRVRLSRALASLRGAIGSAASPQRSTYR